MPLSHHIKSQAYFEFLTDATLFRKLRSHPFQGQYQNILIFPQYSATFQSLCVELTTRGCKLWSCHPLSVVVQ